MLCIVIGPTLAENLGMAVRSRDGKHQFELAPLRISQAAPDCWAGLSTLAA